ncbi:hypothetical protein [Neisseria dumasiana]|uniref:Uncharacterized protein n=1 Tax=Neisseria dumasiana TaxID=1931275 RepID=A0A1X3DL06_9NEIS|nr:hypothetical protein [Neisseria dumasiana]OSI25051.1 hypothetical protein BV912_01350 [Neisseria dumasiana]
MKLNPKSSQKSTMPHKPILILPLSLEVFLIMKFIHGLYRHWKLRWQANKSAPTPTLDAIASARGVNADELKRKALDKALKFELLTAHVAGLRQAAEDKIRLAQTLEDIAAIQCDFCGPSDTIGIS